MIRGHYRLGVGCNFHMYLEYGDPCQFRHAMIDILGPLYGIIIKPEPPRILQSESKSKFAGIVAPQTLMAGQRAYRNEWDEMVIPRRGMFRCTTFISSVFPDAIHD